MRKTYSVGRSGEMIATVSLIFLMVSKIWQCTIKGFIPKYFLVMRILRVQMVVSRLYSIIAVIVWAMRRLQIGLSTRPSLKSSFSFGGSEEPGIRSSTPLLGSTYVEKKLDNLLKFYIVTTYDYFWYIELFF